MKAVIAFLMLLIILAACASAGDRNQSDAHINYGGSVNIRGTVSHIR